MEPALWVGPAIIAAAIAGLINVAGWFVTLRNARRLELERRAEKVIDTHTAILAEIRSDLTTLDKIDATAEVEATRQRLMSAPLDHPYTPFVPKDSGAPIFSAIVTDITVLPTEVIDSVVLYYKLREAIAHFAEDLRADSFSKLPPDRKLTMMEDYFRLKTHAATLARQAIAVLERSLGLPLSVNSMAAAPLARGSVLGGAVASGPSSSVSSDTRI
ncbi:MAG: hypothetical protein ACRED5_18205 [Propylenella sp.]